MSIIDWSPAYTVNNAALDAQHQEIFSIINELHRSLLSHDKRSEATSIAIRELLAHAKTHFPDEEQQMLAVNYPDLREHQAAHAELIRKILEIEKRSKETSESMGPDLLGFLIIEWVVTHILVADKKLAPYLKQ